MKRITLLASMVIAMLAYTPDASAQSMLKKLKNQAVQAAGQALGKNKPAQPVLPTQPTTADAPQITPDVDPDVTNDPVLSLLTQRNIDGLSNMVTTDYETELPNATLTQVLQSRPSDFDYTLLGTPEGREKIEKAKAAQDRLILGYQQAQLRRSVAMAGVTPTTAAPTKGNQAAMQLGQEIMARAQAKGINMERATEAQMKQVTAEVVGGKLGIPTAEMLKIYNLPESQVPQYIRTHYPQAEKKAAALGLVPNTGQQSGNSPAFEIFQQLSELHEKHLGSYEQMGQDIANQAEKMKSILAAAQAGQEISEDEGDELTGLSDFQKRLRKSQRQVVASWPTSDACKQVQQLNEELCKRTDEFLEANPNAKAMPSWWLETRQKQNAIVRAWNAQQAKAWSEEYKNVGTQHREYLQQVAALDARLDALDATDPFYNSARALSGSFLPSLLEYVTTPYCILDCPQANYLSEDPTPIIEEFQAMGKG